MQKARDHGTSPLSQLVSIRFIPTRFHVPRGTQVPAALFSVSGTRLSLALAGLSRPLPLPTPRSRMPALQPRMNESMRFGLIPVRSPLLGESRLISFPSGTEMFHFPEFAPCNLCIQLQVTGYDSRRVSPFRDPRIKGCLAPPRGLSQLTTSFIAFRRQGIHPMLLSTCLLEKNFLPSLFNCKGAASFLGMVVGLERLELSTSRLSGVRSNHLSYRPMHTSQ